ncbi:ATP-dependent DNA helicase RecG [Patescibacteria group bacterium]|nr:ATP-dependent DNA helicase RecG [Patescibacteria group bacterium]MBU1951667.1 ATP-dependent DNA helicase RecG [Patescibacteria group bacterium]
MELSTSIAEFPTVGPRTAQRLKKLEIKTAEDLLFYFPFRYEDYSNISNIREARHGESTTIKAHVDLIHNKRSPRKRMIITEAILSDDTGSIKAVWFRQPFLTKIILPGDELFLSGKVEGDLLSFQMINPVYEKVKSIPLHTARLVPVYPTTAGITQKQIRFLIKHALPAVDMIVEWLPSFIKNKYRFLGYTDALRQIHFPQTTKLLEKARKRIGFNELFLIQLGMLKTKYELANRQAPSMVFQEKEVKKFVDNLPFTLTEAQKKSSWEIIKDLEKGHPMNRLLEGDVGSGKTVVAALGMINTVSNGFQTAIMAPTEILALQHFNTLQKLFQKEKNIHICILTSTQAKKTNSKEVKKADCLKEIKSGKINIVVGTHSLIQKSVLFKNLAFIIVDEQHRFGVNQRKAIMEKNPKETSWTPHLLSMTATPIPRSLALTVYGDLDLSIIDQLPKGRKKISTSIVPKFKRQDAYNFIKKEIQKGRQVFVICPLIEESDKLGVKAVTSEYEKLNKEVFPDISIGILHGKMKSKEKEDVMNKFVDNKLKILVATSVIEVGVDIPNTTIMMIEGAERFGLAQLHQFRGRVGRSTHQSYCLLFFDQTGPDVLERLQAFAKSHNGFDLAEKDLALRGPGEVYGSKQSGHFPNLKVARLTDYELVRKARSEAEQLLKNDPHLNKNQFLKKKIADFTKNVHLE